MLKIESDGTAGGTTVLWNEEVLNTVQSVNWSMDLRGGSNVDISFLVVPLESVDGKVNWLGLQEVPKEALEAELERRQP